MSDKLTAERIKEMRESCAEDGAMEAAIAEAIGGNFDPSEFVAALDELTALRARVETLEKAEKQLKDWRDRNTADAKRHLWQSMGEDGRGEVRAENRVLDFALKLLAAPAPTGATGQENS